MVPFPSGWIQQFGVNLVSAFPEQLGARFRYHERLRPQPAFSAIVEQALASDPLFRVHEIGDMVRLVTLEGEYGAWVRIEGTRERRDAVRFVGAVLADELATALDVIALLPPHFAEVERLAFDLLRQDRLQLTGRPRRFFYVPPPGWQAVISGVTANWYPLDFPNNRTLLAVAPAAPVAEAADRARELAFAGVQAGLEIERVAREALTSSSGMPGACIRVHGRRAGNPDPIYRELAMFVVDDRTYTFRLETTMRDRVLDLSEVLRGVACSFKPLPSAEEMRLGVPFVPQEDVFDHWIG